MVFRGTRINNKTQAAKFLDISENEILDFGKHDNGDWLYKDRDNYWHLFRFENNKYIELTKNVNALYLTLYNNGDWSYVDDDGYEYLFRQKTTNM